MGARGERARRGAADSGPLLLRGDAVWWQARAGRVTRRQEAEWPRGAGEHGRAAFPARGAARPPRGGSGGRVGSRCACGWGAPGGPSGPGVSPKSLFRPRMGAGLRKWRGSQISEGQGRGGRDGRAASPGRASLRILDVCRRGSPAPNFSSVQTFRSQRPGSPRRGSGSARGNPGPPPAGGKGGSSGGHRRSTLLGSAVGSASGTAAPTLACFGSASARTRPASSEVPCAVCSGG